MNKSGKKWFFPALRKRFSHAIAGVVFAIRTQPNARIHLLAVLTVCTAGTWFRLSSADWRWIIASMGLVWFSEMVNTAFEYLCDVVMPEFHLSVKRAKDIAAGAVLICATGSVMIALLTFWPYILPPP